MQFGTDFTPHAEFLQYGTASSHRFAIDAASAFCIGKKARLARFCYPPIRGNLPNAYNARICLSDIGAFTCAASWNKI